MRRAVYLLLAFLIASPSFAQTCQANWSSVQASKIIDLSGSLLTSGSLSITGVDANRNIINFGAPGGGAVMTVAKKAPISNGAIVGTLCVPRSDKASVYVRYHIVIVDNSASGTHAVVLDVNDVPITTDVFSLDAYPFPADAYANPPNVFTSGQVNGDLNVTGTIYAGTISGATAVNAQHANTADTATSATTAANATNADHATTADSATTATTATSATTATTAFSATVANALATAPTDCGSEAINGINADGSPKSCIAPGAGGGFSNGLWGFGDSILQATGASSTGPGNAAYQQGYGYLWQQAVGGTYLPGGTSGDQEADGNYKWIYRVVSPLGNGMDPTFFHELGTNDAPNYQGDANKQMIFQRELLGSLAWLGTPQANKTFAQSCTLAGGFAADPNQLYAGLGVVATTNGATASCAITAPKASDTLYACYLIQDGNTGTFTVSLDGVAQNDPFNGTTTWDAYGDGGALIHTQNNTNDAVACARFTGVAAGSHTILFTVTSATSSTAAVWPQWVGAAPVGSATLNPTVIAVSPNQQNTGSAGAPYVATYQGYITTAVDNLAADGENLFYSDTSNALLNDPSCGNGIQATMFANCYVDAYHPNNTGHAVMAKTVEATTPAAKLKGVTQWNPHQPLQAFSTMPIQSPYQWLDLNPYNQSFGSTWGPGIKITGANGQFFGLGQGPAGVTVLAPNGTYGFAVCPFGNSGFFPATPPALSSCFLDVKMNGLVEFFGGSLSPYGVSIQSGQVNGGTNVGWYIPGTITSVGAKSGVYATTTATSGQNYNSACWNFLGSVWDMQLGEPGNNGPCLQFVPISPTPAGEKGDGYLTLQITAGVPFLGLDLSHTTKTNHLGNNADAGTLSVTTLNVGGNPVTSPIILTSPSLGGSALAAGACSSTTLTQSGTSGTSRVLMTPDGGGPGDAYYWNAYVSSVNTITAKVCAVIAGTPAAQTYTLEVHP